MVKMKKIICAFLIICLFTTLVSTKSLAADMDVYSAESDKVFLTPNVDGKYSYEYKDARADYMYVLLVIAGFNDTLEGIDISESNSKILYIDQKTAGNEGVVFNNFIPMKQEDATVFIIGEDKTVHLAGYIKGNSDEQVAAPTADPTEGEVMKDTVVKLSSTTVGATIYYTMGNDPDFPTVQSTEYKDSTGIVITETTTIKAIAIKEGMANSDVSVFSYSVKSAVEYTITFELNGHGDAISPIKATAGSFIPEPVEPRADGWVFKGWYKDNDYTQAWDFIKDRVESDIILYAKWAAQGDEDDADDSDKFTVVTIKPLTYTGTVLKPDVQVKHGGRRLIINQDYTLSYKNNIKVGTAKVIVKGKGNYSESQTVEFTIEPKNLSSSDIIIDDLAFAYNKNKAQKKAPTITYNGKKLKVNTDYTVSYGEGNFKDPGVYMVTFSGKGNYTGQATGKVIILDKSKLINNAKLKLPKTKYDYTGNAITPDVTVTLNGVTLKENKDYTVSYANNVKSGKANIIVKGIGEYAGTKKSNFTINKQVVNLTGDMIYVPGTVEYVKGGCTPEPAVSDGSKTLTKGIDYTVSYKKNKKVGTASVIIKGKGIYKGTVAKPFEITLKDISKISMRAPDIIYTSKTKAGKYKSKPVLTDVNGNILNLSDYTDITYKYSGENLNNKSKPAENSVITVTVTGKGNYIGTASTEYTLKNVKAFSKARITIGNKRYTGRNITLDASDIKVIMGGSILEYGKDFEIVNTSYRNNIKKGTAYVTVRGIDEYAGEKTVKFKITARTVNESWISKIFGK